MQLNEILKNIDLPDEAAMERAQAHLDNIAKPIGSLGKLEEIIVRLAGMTRSDDIQKQKKCVLVFCADNGVVAQGVAQSTHEVTTSIFRSLLAQHASVNVLARAAGADSVPYDVGMVDDVDGVPSFKTANGTNDFTTGPAMTREQAVQAILTGYEMATAKIKDGYGMLATGEAGIGNTTTSSAIASVLLGMPVKEVTGRGSGLTDEGLERKRNAIQKGIDLNQPDPADPIDVLAKVGGFDIAAMAGTFIAGAEHHIPVVMDGIISSVSALIATRLCPAVREYIIPSHVSAEPAGHLIMEELNFSPALDAGMRLGEGSGAAAFFPFIDMAITEYNEAARFEMINVEQYERLS